MARYASSRLPFASLRPGPLMLLPLAALLIGVMWSVYQHLDPTRGFDYGGHLDYLRYVDFTASLPLADRGWQMYHPPAYYVVTAGAFEIVHRLGVAVTLTDMGRAVASSAWALQGLIAAFAVRAFAGRWLGAAAAAGVAWLIPGQAIMGTMVYNETFTGLGVALLVLGMALWARQARVGLAFISVGFALALLSKYSGLVAAAVALPLIIWMARDRLRPVMIALAPGILLGGAFYGRNLLRFGTPIPSNIVLFHLKDWDFIGYGHPAGFFTRWDGSSCAAAHSFWAGLWKWFWATDCFNLPWRSQVTGRLLLGAVLTTIVVLAALVWTSWRAVREPSLLVLSAIPAAVLVGFIVYNVRWPALTSDKGVYILAALVPAAVSTGLLLDRVAAGRIWTVVAYVGVLGWSAFMFHASALG